METNWPWQVSKPFAFQIQKVVLKCLCKIEKKSMTDIFGYKSGFPFQNTLKDPSYKHSQSSRSVLKDGFRSFRLIMKRNLII